jgi:hypothetical protein
MGRRESGAAPLLRHAQHRAEIALRTRPHEVRASQHDLRQKVGRCPAALAVEPARPEQDDDQRVEWILSDAHVQRHPQVVEGERSAVEAGVRELEPAVGRVVG